MSNGKKWYTYFVSVEETAGQAASGAGTGSAASGDVAKTVADIADSIQMPQQQKDRMDQKFQAAAQQTTAATGGPGAKPMPFNEIYAAAEIVAPPHGYTVLKVAEMLQSPHIKELPLEVKRSSVLVALDAAGVKIQEIVEDAIRRDKALDTFERVQQKQLEDFEAAKLEENRKLQTELDKLTAEYKAKIQSNNEAATQRKEAFFGWRVDKQKMEQKIADAVSPFVTENPITTSSRPAPAGKTGI